MNDRETIELRKWCIEQALKLNYAENKIITITDKKNITKKLIEIDRTIEITRTAEIIYAYVTYNRDDGFVFKNLIDR